jgi:hypothetical protein
MKNSNIGKNQLGMPKNVEAKKKGDFVFACNFD